MRVSELLLLCIGTHAPTAAPLILSNKWLTLETSAHLICTQWLISLLQKLVTWPVTVKICILGVNIFRNAKSKRTNFQTSAPLFLHKKHGGQAFNCTWYLKMASGVVERCSSKKNLLAFGSTLALKNRAFYERYSGVKLCRARFELRTYNFPLGSYPSNRVSEGSSSKF